MSNYCIVIDAEVTWGPGPLPERITLPDGTTRTSLDEMSAGDLLEIGLYPVVEDIPSYDAQTQRLAQPPTLTIDTDHVDAVYTAENIPDPAVEETRMIGRKDEALTLWETLATALDVPVKAPDLELYRRIQTAARLEETFAVEVDGETRTLTPAELHTLAKDVRTQYKDNGGVLTSLADPATSGIDLTFQFEFFPTSASTVSKCICRLIRAQWHSTGYDLPATAAFMADMFVGANNYMFTYIGDWCVLDGNNTGLACNIQGFSTQNIAAWWGGAVSNGFGTANQHIITADEGFESFTPTTGTRKVIRVASYPESQFVPENLHTADLPVDEPISDALALAASWPDFANTSLWSFMAMGASTIEQYHEWFGEMNGHTGKHYQFGSTHSYQGPTDPAPTVDFMGSWVWPYAPASYRGHLVTLNIMASSGDAHNHVYITGGGSSTDLGNVQVTVNFPGWTVNGETFNCA